MNNNPFLAIFNPSPPPRNSAEEAFANQDDEEFVEITSNGVAVPMNPNQTPRGASVRDVKGEYGLFNKQE